jgi:hypothetical protein
VMPIKTFHKFHIALRKLVRSQRNTELIIDDSIK